jgi:hypothetical protein
MALDNIIQFFNDAKSTDDIVGIIKDDPTFGKSDGAYGIRTHVANNVLKARSKLPGDKFTEIKQIDAVHGIGPDTLNDIFYMFYSDLMKTKQPQIKPEVILDFVYDKNLLYIIIENIGDAMAHKVSIDFDKKILGLNAEKDVSKMKIFKHLSTIPPKKRLNIFVDVFNSYVKNNQPLTLISKITYYDNNQRRFVDSIKHDLRIYSDFTETLNPN